MSLNEEFAEAWREQRGLPPYGWVVNMEPTRAYELGEVSVPDAGVLNYETTLDRRGVTGLEVLPELERDESSWSCATNQDIAVHIASEGDTSGAAQVIGKAGYTVDIAFGSHAGVSAYGTAMWWRRYADMGMVRASVIKAAEEERLHAGESIVVELQLSGKGVMVLAEGSNASLQLKANADVKVGATPSLASLSGSLEVTNATGAAEQRQFPDGSVLAMRVLTLGYRGFFWWRGFEVYGFQRVDPAQARKQAEESELDPVEGNGPREYFALLS